MLLSTFINPFLKRLAVFLLLCASTSVFAQHHLPFDRLPRSVLDVAPPHERVTGEPGEMAIVNRSCLARTSRQNLRERIVNIALQEWAYFGFSVDDMTRNALNSRRNFPRGFFRRPFLSEEEAKRVSPSIAGYWAAAPDSSWILARQNDNWKNRGLTARWRDPWSAAFISWVMCESGLEENEFSRAVAHHTYIDQAIRARDGSDTQASFTAYDVGEMDVQPGDLLCRGSRPEYISLAQRRSQMGVGARTHCDIVVQLDTEERQIMVIGGNVRGSVRMKLFPAAINALGNFSPLPYGRRQIFAHLKLSHPPLDKDLISTSPVLQQYGAVSGRSAIVQ